MPSLPGLHTEIHGHFGDPIVHNIVQSEVEGGVYLADLAEGAALEVQTRNRSYRLVNRGEGKALISGHPEFCPDPVLVTVDGSNWGGSMLKTSYIGRGMHLEFRHPAFQTIVTSRIVDVREI